MGRKQIIKSKEEKCNIQEQYNMNKRIKRQENQSAKRKIVNTCETADTKVAKINPNDSSVSSSPTNITDKINESTSITLRSDAAVFLSLPSTSHVDRNSVAINHTKLICENDNLWNSENLTSKITLSKKSNITNSTFPNEANTSNDFKIPTIHENTVIVKPSTLSPVLTNLPTKNTIINACRMKLTKPYLPIIKKVYCPTVVNSKKTVKTSLVQHDHSYSCKESREPCSDILPCHVTAEPIINLEKTVNFLSVQHDHSYNRKQNCSEINLKKTINSLSIQHNQSHPCNEPCSVNVTSEPIINLENTVNYSSVQHDHSYNTSNSFESNKPHPRERRSIQKGFRNIINSNFDALQSVEKHYAGKMDISCVHCKAKHFQAEKVSNRNNSFNDCCSHGAVVLEPLPHPPLQLYDLFLGGSPSSSDFLKSIRAYNSAFAFASFNANLVNFGMQRRGPYCFKIMGQIYYQINTALYPSTNENPSYGQLFIVDSNEATKCRKDYNSNLNDELLQLLNDIISKNNIFAKSYAMMHEVVQNQVTSVNNLDKCPEMCLGFITKKSGIDRGRYNVQTCNEVAAIFSTSADGEIPDTYVTISNKKEKKLQYVSTMDPNVEPWIYPLFYPYGTQGWHADLKRENSNKRVSRAAYLKYRIAVRDEVNLFLMGRRLYQQWLVDNYVKIEKDKINFCRAKQKELRAESYQGLIDYLNNSANEKGTRVGKMIILPSTFIGSPRNMMQNYQDAMAIVRKFGKPDIFLTMTCNPNWSEITENLLPGQQTSDRPDICARVFNIKKDYLIDLIVRQQFFGEVLAYVYVIEFQKRGLPHIHLLITLKNKLLRPEDVDKYISAEIPDKNINNCLYNIVMKNMIHGPCGDWCMKNDKCSKNFPKDFQEETTMDDNGYPKYRRRNDGMIHERPNGYQVDNQYVVSYNPQLLLIFDSHINVEVVSSIKSVKYLYKYIYKGHDAAKVVVAEQNEEHDNPNNNIGIVHDEIKDYVEGRYVGPVEACWRILGKILHEKSHAITRLPVHLPNEQNIVIGSELNDDEIRSALDRDTMLIDYFNLNARDPEARNYFYSEIPLHYVFKKRTVNGKVIGRWEKRQRYFNCIGRMYSVNPSQIELFHLRILLLNVKGAKSYEDLRTVDGIVKSNFTQACLALGLIENDDEWNHAMTEAKSWMMPNCLRNLFVRILMHCQPAHPEILWEEFQLSMAEDFMLRYGNNIGLKKNYDAICNALQKEGWSINDFGIKIDPSIATLDINNANFNDQGDVYQHNCNIAMTQYQQLNEKQKQIVDDIILIVDNPTTTLNSKCIYIDGPGGSGKTFIYSTLYHQLQMKNKTVCTMAFTGIAATLLPNGKTVHKTLGLPVPLFSDSCSQFKLHSKEAQYLKKVDVFIWDEAPMAPRYALEIMDRTLRDIVENDQPFGGKVVILGGDFRQLLPVKVNGTRSEVINLTIKCSELWRLFHIYSLTENMRTSPQEREFSEYLLQVGDGLLNDSNDIIKLPEKCNIQIDVDIAHDVYSEIIQQKQFRYASKCVILSARNVDVDEINKKVVSLLPDDSEVIYTSIDSAESHNRNEKLNEAVLPEYLNTLNPASLPPHELRLRKYTVVMLIRNLNINEGLCNGTRLLILDLNNNSLKCEILTGDKSGKIVFLHRITLLYENVYPFTLKRRQFPIKIAFVMTINKSQGQTFEKVAIDLRKDVFIHGQIYVAFSRVRSWKSLNIYIDKNNVSRSIKNYVFKEIL